MLKKLVWIEIDEKRYLLLKKFQINNKGCERKGRDTHWAELFSRLFAYTGQMMS